MKPFQILLAEDNRGDVILIRKALEKHCIPHDLQVAADGEQAIRFIGEMGTPGGSSFPDVVLLDLNLPRADGIAILTEFRKNPECRDIPVIVVTSSNAPRDRDRAHELGVKHYFQKPSDLDEFMKLGALVSQVIQPI